MSRSYASIRNVSKTYGQGRTRVHALRGVDMDVALGEVTMIRGPSGSGKTTLLQILGLLQRADGGSIWMAGERVDRVPESGLALRRRRHVGFVFQGFNLLDALTARDNVSVGTWLRDRTDTAASSRDDLADACIDRVGLTPRRAHLPAELSGGEKQRISIARALACPGLLILADEPTANLDWTNACDVMAHLLSLAREHGRAVVFVSHDLRLERFADKIIQLTDGRITEQDSHTEVDGPMTTDVSTGKTMDDDSAPPHEPASGGHRLLWGGVLLALAVATVVLLAKPGLLFPSAEISQGESHAVAQEPYVAGAPAVVEPATKLIALGTERPGRIKSILKRAGEVVHAGDTIVVLDDFTTAATVALRRADLELAQADLAKLKAWYRDEERAQAKARLDRVQVRLDRAEREHRRLEGLHADASASDTEFSEALEEVRAARADVEEAEQAYIVTTAGPTVEDVLIAESRVAQAQAALALARAELDLRTIRSPIDGHVIYRHREPGETVNPDSLQPIVSLGDLHDIRLRAEVDESDIGRVHVGQRVVATADALDGKRLTGRVVHMEPIMGRKSIRTQRTTEIKDTKVREVLIELDPGHPILPIDLQMSVRFLDTASAPETDTPPER